MKTGCHPERVPAGRVEGPAVAFAFVFRVIEVEEPAIVFRSTPKPNTDPQLLFSLVSGHEFTHAETAHPPLKKSSTRRSRAPNRKRTRNPRPLNHPSPLTDPFRIAIYESITLRDRMKSQNSGASLCLWMYFLLDSHRYSFSAPRRISTQHKSSLAGAQEDTMDVSHTNN
jgi:hypothetical protein